MERVQGIHITGESFVVLQRATSSDPQADESAMLPLPRGEDVFFFSAAWHSAHFLLLPSTTCRNNSPLSLSALATVTQATFVFQAYCKASTFPPAAHIMAHCNLGNSRLCNI